MTDRQLRKASRLELLQILLEQKRENESLRQQIAEMEQQLLKRQITIDQAGTLAEAALKLSGIFDAAESACQYYSENIRTLSGRQEEICRTMERETREKCDRMLEQAKQMARVYWDEYKEKCNNYMKSMETAQRAAEISECSQMEAI